MVHGISLEKWWEVPGEHSQESMVRTGLGMGGYWEQVECQGHHAVVRRCSDIISIDA